MNEVRRNSQRSGASGSLKRRRALRGDHFVISSEEKFLSQITELR